MLPLQRLDYIHRTIKFSGVLDRASYIIEFGITPTQATMDITKYCTQHPGLITYNAKLKCYVTKNLVRDDD